MLTLSLSNFRIVNRATIPLGRLTLVGGPNHAGKSTVALATAALLTATRSLLPGGKIGDVGQWVTTGRKSGEIALSGPDGSIKLGLPKAQLTASDTPPTASIWASGLRLWSSTNAREAAAAFQQTWRSNPTRAMFGEELFRQGINDHPWPGRAPDGEPVESTIEREIWAAIERDGWDAAQSAVNDRTRQLKRDFEELTGTTWGAQQGAGWEPAGWTPPAGFEEHRWPDVRDILEAAVDKARAAFNAISSRSAASAQDIAELRPLAGGLKAAQDQLAATSLAYTQARMAEDQALKALHLEAPPGIVMCPSCRRSLKIKPRPADDKRPEGFDVEVAVHDDLLVNAGISGKVSHAEDATLKVGQAKAAYEQAEDRVRRCREADQKLKILETGPAVDSTKLDLATADLAAATSILEGSEAVYRARHLHERIIVLTTLQAILAPEGLRAARSLEVLAECNADLQQLCGWAGWPNVQLASDFQPLMEGRAYWLLGGMPGTRSSFQWQVDAIMAVAAARADGSAMVVLDAAETLDPKGRTGLFRMLNRSGVPALIGMMFGSREKMPDVGRAGGTSYWVDGGTVEKLAGGESAS